MEETAPGECERARLGSYFAFEMRGYGIASGTAPKPFDSFPHQGNGSRELLQDDLGLDAQHLTPEPTKIAISARIGGSALPMVSAIHFHHQPQRRCEEVRDEISEHDLPTEAGPELSGGEFAPELGFRLRGSVAVLPSPRGEKASASERL